MQARTDTHSETSTWIKKLSLKEMNLLFNVERAQMALELLAVFFSSTLSASNTLKCENIHCPSQEGLAVQKSIHILIFPRDGWLPKARKQGKAF